MVVEAADEQDVRTVVEFATTRGMPVAVQATGHGRSSAMHGGVLISTRRMCGVDVDPQAETAWVEAGASWQHVIDAATVHGLAPLSGSLPGVGAVSYTLGGGVGLLARRYGFAADHVHRLEVATPDGRLRRVTATDEPHLFWALRGGGGNFGVVTGMEIALMPVARLYGGCLFVDLAQVPNVLHAWREWTDSVPDEMTSAVSVIPFPDLPMVPEPMRGRHVAQLQISYAGPAEQGQQLVEPLRALGPLLQDTLRELSYSESGAVFDEPDQPSGYRGTSLLLDDLDPQELSTLVHQVGPSASSSCVVGLRHLGGALARPPQTPNALGHRDASYSLGLLSLTETSETGSVTALHDQLLAEFAPHALGRSLNFTFGPLDHQRVRTAFEPADYQRLAQLKAEHDPHGLLQANHPIPPATD
ncbi:FAD-binding oxidoreductase [Bounagaea algeriensis]